MVSLETLEKLTERLIKLRTQEISEYEFFWNNSLGLFVISDLEYFVRVNPRWEEVTGFTAEELTAEPFWKFIHPEDLEKTQARVIEGSVDFLPTQAFVNRFKTKSGGYARIEWITRGTVRGYFCSIGRHLGDET